VSDLVIQPETSMWMAEYFEKTQLEMNEYYDGKVNSSELGIVHMCE
jgi:hypothetical protein